jgi:hypothetical protein
MAEILLVHHPHGQTAGFLAFADARILVFLEGVG